MSCLPDDNCLLFLLRIAGRQVELEVFEEGRDGGGQSEWENNCMRKRNVVGNLGDNDLAAGRIMLEPTVLCSAKHQTETVTRTYS